VFVTTHSRRSPRSGGVQTCQRSDVLTSFTPKSFPLNLFADPPPPKPCRINLLQEQRGRRGHTPYRSYPYTGTLPRLISFVCHSYANCRVCTRNSHSGTHHSTRLSEPLPVRKACIERTIGTSGPLRQSFLRSQFPSFTLRGGCDG
jgi:hypothetical protein